MLIALCFAGNLEDAGQWLKNHYEKNPVGGNWTVTRLEFKGNDIYVMLSIPDEQASRIMRQSSMKQFMAIGTVCPGKVTLSAIVIFSPCNPERIVVSNPSIC